MAQCRAARWRESNLLKSVAFLTFIGPIILGRRKISILGYSGGEKPGEYVVVVVFIEDDYFPETNFNVIMENLNK